MATWPGPITAVTLFVEDLAAARQFYREVFDLPVHYEDDNSAVFDFGNTIINLLKTDAAHDLVAPAAAGALDAVHDHGG
jgi:catechol 2,3-dioxygenase-like lactoylglutathione lyase family enzyme